MESQEVELLGSALPGFEELSAAEVLQKLGVRARRPFGDAIGKLFFPFRCPPEQAREQIGSICSLQHLGVLVLEAPIFAEHQNDAMQLADVVEKQITGSMWQNAFAAWKTLHIGAEVQGFRVVVKKKTKQIKLGDAVDAFRKALGQVVQEHIGLTPAVGGEDSVMDIKVALGCPTLMASPHLIIQNNKHRTEGSNEEAEASGVITVTLQIGRPAAPACPTDKLAIDSSRPVAYALAHLVLQQDHVAKSASAHHQIPAKMLLLDPLSGRESPALMQATAAETGERLKCFGIAGLHPSCQSGGHSKKRAASPMPSLSMSRVDHVLWDTSRGGIPLRDGCVDGIVGSLARLQSTSSAGADTAGADTAAATKAKGIATEREHSSLIKEMWRVVRGR
jgi:hypothetical protein